MFNIRQKADGAVALVDHNDSEVALLYPATETLGAKGSPSGGTLTVKETHYGAFHQTVFTFADVTIALADEAGVVAYGGLKIYDFPAGAIRHLGSVADLDITKSSAGVNADWDGDFALGSATASNNGSLSSTEANLIPSTATPQAVAGVTTANGLSTATEGAVILDGTTTAADLYLNFLIDDADHNVTGTACNLIVNGTIKVAWMNLGDF
jgi:hypothetical protein